MTLYSLKPAFQARLRPLAGALARTGVTANAVTLGSCALCLAAGAALWLALPRRAPFALLPALLFARMALNALDGMLAREFGQQSRLGALLNELCDVISDAALYLPFALLPHFGAAAVVLVVLLAALAEMAGALAATVGAQRRYDGPLGKSDRALVFGALGLAVGLGLPPAPWQRALFAPLALGLLGTIARRVRGALRESAAHGGEAG